MSDKKAESNNPDLLRYQDSRDDYGDDDESVLFLAEMREAQKRGGCLRATRCPNCRSLLTHEFYRAHKTQVAKILCKCGVESEITHFL